MPGSRSALALVSAGLYAVIFGAASSSAVFEVNAADPSFANLVSHYIETTDPAQRQAVRRALGETRLLDGVSKHEFEQLESALLAYQPEPLDWQRRDGEFAPFPIAVTLPEGRELPVLIQLPPGYHPARLWPLLLAMHGGPGRSPEDGKRGASNMRNAWVKVAGEAGWVVVSPAMSHVYVHGQPTPDRLAYEILKTTQMEAVLDSVSRRVRIDPNAIVSTGVSLGANFSIGYAAARPDRFAAIAPVSSEGEFREPLLRNLAHTPMFAVSGARDRNIRTIDGPRAMNRILEDFDYDVTYRELADRGHEGFHPLYPEILEWAAKRTRNPNPVSVLRVPHRGIFPLARRVFWVETDTRQGVVRAEIRPGNRIELKVRWARSVVLYLNDHLVDLDEAVAVVINGEPVQEKKLERSIALGLEQARLLRDRGRSYSVALPVQVPVTEASHAMAKSFSESLSAPGPGGPLSFWEHFAAGTLAERLPVLGFDGELRNHGRDFAFVEITTVEPEGAFARAGLAVGDRLFEVGGEPFVQGRDLTHLKYWLERELGDQPSVYPLLIERNGARLTLEVALSLEPF